MYIKPSYLFPQSNIVDDSKLNQCTSGHAYRHIENVVPPSQDSHVTHETHANSIPPHPSPTTTNCKSGLKCMYTNTDFLQNKIELIETYAHQNNIDIIAITEIHNKFATREEMLNTKFFLPGYTALQNDDGRGVLLLVKESYKVIQLKHFDSIFSPSIFCRIHTTDEDHFVFGLIYRSPNSLNTKSDTELIMKQIDTVTEKLISTNEKLIITGDFNFPEINWKDDDCSCLDKHPAKQFLSCIHQNFLSQFVMEPTHQRGEQNPSLIDLILSNDSNFVYDLVHDEPFGKSHHNSLKFYIDIQTKKVRTTMTEKYILSKGDYEGMRNYMSEVNWPNELADCEDVDQCWEKIEVKILEATDKFIPKKKFKDNQVMRSFIAPVTLLETIQLKRKAFKTYKTYPTTQNYNTYVFLRNLVNIEVKQAKKVREVKLAKEAKNNPKALFKYMSSKTKPRETIPDLQKNDGNFTEGNKEKAEVLNTFFGSVFTKETDTDMPDCNFPVEGKLTNIEVTEDIFIKLLKKLKPGKSPGPDCIHPLVLREVAEYLAYPFKVLFDLTMRKGQIPGKWKQAEVRPIFKKGAKSSPDNYRPVSLTSVVCKVFEKIVRDHMYKHMIDNNILSTDQFGFCQGRSCVTQLLVTVNDWLFSLDNTIPVDAAYLDFSKAFDSVPHQRLIHKLNAYGLWCPRQCFKLGKSLSV